MLATAFILLVLVTWGAGYSAGWWRLRRRGHPGVARGWPLALYLAGVCVLGVALLSPIDRWASRSFSMHMVQHLLLTMMAPPLLLLGNPLPVVLWALPARARRGVGRLLTRKALARRGLWALTLLPVAWLIYVANLWIWHLPAAYQAALRHDRVHDLEHLAFFGTALLFWWGIVNPAPRLHGRIPVGFQIGYLVAATGQSILLGAVIGVTERVLYPYYAVASPPWGLAPLYDQALGGSLMWVSSHMYLVPILVLVARRLNAEEQRARRSETGTPGPRTD